MTNLGWTRWDTDADDFFRRQALEGGWLKTDPHAPGDGRGMWAWYRENGIVPPENLEKTIRKRESNNWKWGDDCDE